MKIKTIHYSIRDKGQTLIVKNNLERQFVKLNFNKKIKIIKEE